MTGPQHATRAWLVIFLLYGLCMAGLSAWLAYTADQADRLTRTYCDSNPEDC